MCFETLFEGLQWAGTLPKGEASGVAQDSRKVSDGFVFVCIKGRSSDGHDHAEAALEKGAAVVVSERALGLSNEVVVQDTRLAYALLCQRFFDNPAKKLCLIAVTGTNGKTTVSSLIKQVLTQRGIACGLIGTIQSEIQDFVVPARYTTPEAWDLAALMHRMVQAGCTHLVMEASSQALDQGRMLGLHFSLAIFTNLSKDHLDWHGDMEQYFLAKKSLFYHSDKMLTNLDDAYGLRLFQEMDGPEKHTFSCQNDAAEFVAHRIKLYAGEVRFGFLAKGQLYPVSFPMPGDYSVYNAIAVGAAAILLGSSPPDVMQALEQVRGVAGRCETLYNKKFTVIRDYAHTADGLENVLAALKPFVQREFVVLFGCAGERESSKRIEMSRAVLRYADRIYLTSDNPRGEDEQAIFRDALPALQEGKVPYVVLADREIAIKTALSVLEAGDVLVLCGKGHEDYQVLKNCTVYLDEKQLVEGCLLGVNS